MIARTLLYIKHRMPWLWRLVDWLNTRLYSLLHGSRMRAQRDRAFEQYRLDGFEFRPVTAHDLSELERMLCRQGGKRLKYFQPHGFDNASLARMLANPAFLMFGVFDEQRLVGYFFLRCFWNRKCFVGRLIDEPFERRGIGRVMNQIMYHTAWWSGFHCYTTISRRNTAVIRSHRNNPHARFVGELGNDFILVEFKQADASTSPPGLEIN